MFAATLCDVGLGGAGDDFMSPQSPSASPSVCGRCSGMWNAVERVCVDILFNVWV